MTHAYHDALRGYDDRQIWYDDCEECEERGQQLPYSLGMLDNERFARAWQRADDWNHDRFEVTGRISIAERPLLETLWAMQIAFQRLHWTLIKTDTYHATGGEVWSKVHSESSCRGRHCVIHNPSDHNMRDWPMHLRETGLVERICEHGVGHPDPDSRAYFDEYGPIGSRGAWGVHGCDGCCHV
jgi:hypothetical protein